jgi:hypothetical protein
MTKTLLGCHCGNVHLEVSKMPIIVAECYCHSCRDAAERMAALPGASTVTGAFGSTHFVLYRKDRVRITRGEAWLRQFRLGPDAQTRRVIASCCNTPVLLEFKGGHWVSLYGNLWHGQALPIPDLRTQTADAPKGSIGDATVPEGPWETAKFYGKLLATWASMGFKTPPMAKGFPEIGLPRAR